MRPNVPPDFLPVVDAARLDQKLNVFVVIAPGAKAIGKPRPRKSLEHLGPVALPAGVLSAPEGRIDGEGEDVRQKITRRIHQLDARLVVLHGDMNVQPEDEVRAGDHLEVVDDLIVTRRGRDGDVGPVRDGVRACRGDPQSAFPHQSDDFPAQANQ